MENNLSQVAEVEGDANELVSYYNSSLKKFNFKEVYLEQIKIALIPLVEPYADLNTTEDLCTLNYNKLDTQVNYTYNLEQYLNLDSISTSWDRVGYKNIIIKDSNVLSSKDYKMLLKARISRSEKNKTIVQKFHYAILEHNRILKKGISFDNPLNDFRLFHPILYKYYDTLGFQKMLQLKFNNSAMAREYFVQNSTSIEVTIALKKILDSHLTLQKFYSMEYLKKLLCEVYIALENGKKAKATDITKFYSVKSTTRDIGGKIVSGYILLNRQ